MSSSSGVVKVLATEHTAGVFELRLVATATESSVPGLDNAPAMLTGSSAELSVALEATVFPIADTPRFAIANTNMVALEDERATIVVTSYFLVDEDQSEELTMELRTRVWICVSASFSCSRTLCSRCKASV